MEQRTFSDLDLRPELQRAVEEMGFTLTTDIQAQSIPLIQQGRDVIGRSQTGTGKTAAFGIPAIGVVDTESELRTQAQVLVLCPTRELAMQACDELKKLARYMPGIRCADVYGGAPMDRQILKLRTANIVVGTPGRVMDHLRRRTLRLEHLKMVVLDEADEMLSMGFREDIEEILRQTPEERQTVLFSATMPPDILALTRQYQKDPQMVQINREQPTVANIRQLYYEVPMGRKMDALQLLLLYHAPRLALIFTNTKSMVDELAAFLNAHGFAAEGLHGDMKQSQRTKVMESFKHGRTAILVATDVAARGIDVDGIDVVFNYDVPQSTEYYVHRIGRTGRAGRDGVAVTLCSGRRQTGELLQTARFVKAEVSRQDLPRPEEVRKRRQQEQLAEVEAAIAQEPCEAAAALLAELQQRGHAPETIAAALLALHFAQEEALPELPAVPAYTGSAVRAGGMRAQGAPRRTGDYQKIVINIGRQNHVAPNHIVAAITGCTELVGRDIGKIEIYDHETVVGIPSAAMEKTVAAMKDCRIVGQPTETKPYSGGARDVFEPRDGYRAAEGAYRPYRGTRDTRDFRDSRDKRDPRDTRRESRRDGYREHRGGTRGRP